MAASKSLRLELTAAVGSALLTLVMTGFAQKPAKIIDGTPRIIINSRQWSWGLAFPSSMPKSVGINNWRLASGEYATVGIDDSMRWTNDFGVGNWKSLDFRGNDTPVVMITFAATNKVNGPTDTANINLGARKLKMLADSLKGRGVDWVIFTTRHHKKARWREQCRAYDDWGDTLILKAYSKLMGERLHADVLTTSRATYPNEVVEDFEHPNSYTATLYHTRWFQAMYAHDSVAAPASLETALASELAKEQQKRAKMIVTIKSPLSDTVRIGQQMTIEVTGDSTWVNQSIYGNKSYYSVNLVGYKCVTAGIFPISDTNYVTSKKMSFTFTIPDSSGVVVYGFGTGRYSVLTDSAQIQVRFKQWNGGQYHLSKTFRIADRDGNLVTSVGPRAPSWRYPEQARPFGLSVDPTSKTHFEPLFDLRGRAYVPAAHRRSSAAAPSPVIRQK